MALALRLRRVAVALSSAVHPRPSPSLSSSPLPFLANPNPNPIRPHSMIQSQSFRSSPSAWAAYRNDSSGGQDINPNEILFEGCDYNHWLITIDFPKDPKPSPEEMVEFYVQTCAKVFGSVEEAKKRIYACSTTTYEGFQAVMTEEVSEQFKNLPNVLFVLPDSYIDPVNKQYGGDKYDNGVITPRPPPVQYRQQRPDRRNFNQPRYSGPQEQSPPQQGYQPRDLPPPVQDGQNYGPPKQNYGPPQQNYGPPQQNYGPPQQNYGPPQQNYGLPRQNYGPPQGQGGRVYGPPGGRGFPSSGERRDFGQGDRRVVGQDGGREFNQGQGGNYPPQGQQNFSEGHGGDQSSPVPQGSGGQGQGSGPTSSGEHGQSPASGPGYGGDYNPGQSYSGPR